MLILCDEAQPFSRPTSTSAPVGKQYGGIVQPPYCAVKCNLFHQQNNKTEIFRAFKGFYYDAFPSKIATNPLSGEHLHLEFPIIATSPLLERAFTCRSSVNSYSNFSQDVGEC